MGRGKRRGRERERERERERRLAHIEEQDSLQEWSAMTTHMHMWLFH